MKLRAPFFVSMSILALPICALADSSTHNPTWWDKYEFIKNNSVDVNAGSSASVSFGKNVDVSNECGPQSETFITINPAQPRILAAGSNEIFRLPMRGYFSNNGGTSWGGVDLPLPSAKGQGVNFGSDPGLTFDTRGNGFYSYIVVYVGNLIYTLVTHSDVFASEEDAHNTEKPSWSLGRALAVLLGATVAVALEAELVSGALEASATALGLTTFFLGIIVLPIVGNAAEYFSAVYFARKDRMGLVVGIAVGASIQVALLTAPLLVLISYLMGHPMNLVFSNPLELIALAGVAFAVNSIAQDGETTWFEGLLLLAVYALLALAFFFATPNISAHAMP